MSYLSREASAHRRVLILVSDNVPTVEPRITPKAVTRMASETETVIYSIQTSGPRVGQYFSHLGNIEQIAKEAGGEVIGADRPGAVSSALAAIVNRLKTRYTLGYYPTNKARDGTFRVIELRLADRFGQLYADYTILARRGYYAPI
jgi:Ca-activated chloride channel family protein